jgi:hypothetical protein
MAVDDIYRWAGTATMTNHTFMNTYAFRLKVATDPSEAAMATLAEDLKELIRPAQAPACSWYQWTLNQLWGNNMTILGSTCKRDGGKQFGGIFTGTLTGGQVTTETLPPQCAAVVTLQTGLIGRRKRGRVYFFGLCEPDQTGGIFSSTFMTPMTTRLNTFMNKYRQGGTSPDFTLGVWSERIASGCIPNPNGKGHIPQDSPHPEQAFQSVVGYTLRNIVYTQRRRTYGVGG